MQFTVTIEDACTILGCHARTLQRWRHDGIGPLWTRTRKPDYTGRDRLPGDVLYNRESVLLYEHKTEAEIREELQPPKPPELPAPEIDPPATPEQIREIFEKIRALAQGKPMPLPYGRGHGVPPVSRTKTPAENWRDWLNSHPE